MWRVAMWYPEVVEKLIVMAGPHPQLFLNNMDADQKKRCCPPRCVMHYKHTTRVVPRGCYGQLGAA